MPCPFAGPKMFSAGPIYLSQPKNLTAFSASSKTFVPAKKPILLNSNLMQIIFLTGTKCLWLPQNVNKFLDWHKNFGPVQKILGPVKGQGIRTHSRSFHQNEYIHRIKIKTGPSRQIWSRQGPIFYFYPKFFWQGWDKIAKFFQILFSNTVFL